jgi:putative transposase
MCGVSATYCQQKAELPGIKEAMPEYVEVNAQVLQDVILRVDRAFQGFLLRIREGRRPLHHLHLSTIRRSRRRSVG